MMNQEYLWWKTGVIYQIYPRSYLDTSGNGIGDIPGIIQKLEYLSGTLGIDAIWLSPFYPSPMADFGYDVSNYTNVDPMFGNLGDFDRLVEEAHNRQIKVIIDLVPNHSSDKHPWFKESRSSRDNPKRNWYIWADARPDGSPPNNWLSVFGGRAWEWDQTTKQYYLHSFLKEQPDLNWRNPEVQEAIFDAVRFWLERGVDGFRVDVAHYIMKDPFFRDNPVSEMGYARSVHRPLSEYDSQIHINDKGHPDVHRVYRDFRKLLDEYSTDTPRMSIGEIHIFEWKEWASYYGENLDELHMPYNFSLLGTAWKASAMRNTIEALEGSLPEGAWPNYVLGNHDESRVTSRIGEENAPLAAMMLLTLRGTPTIYYGDEIGMLDVDIPLDQQKDPAGIRQPGQGRDMCRTPMQWTGDIHAGFTDASTKELWLPLHPRFKQINVETQLAEPASLLNLYRQLLSLRKKTAALHRGSFQAITVTQEDCFVYLRELDAERILVLLNFSSNPMSISVPLNGNGKLLLSTTMVDHQNIDLNQISLTAQEGKIIRIID